MELMTKEINNAIVKIANFEKEIKKIKEQQESLKAMLLEEMEKYNILKLEDEHIRINYIAESDTEYFDKTTFKKENPDIYDNYVSMRPKKAYVKITVK